MNDRGEMQMNLKRDIDILINMQFKYVEAIFLLVFAAFIGICSVGCYSKAEYLLCGINFVLAVISIFYAGRVSAR